METKQPGQVPTANILKWKRHKNSEDFFLEIPDSPFMLELIQIPRNGLYRAIVHIADRRYRAENGMSRKKAMAWARTTLIVTLRESIARAQEITAEIDE